MEICLCMIIRNEEQHIRMCLENAFQFVDKAVIVDTGSTDRTLAILQEFGDRVEIRHFTWTNDFAAARNYSLQDISSDWILVLDADEKLVCNPQKLREELQATTAEGYNITMFDSSTSNDTAMHSATVYGRLFRNKGYQFYRAVHEQLNIDMDKVKRIEKTICKIIHYGYSAETIAEKEKVKRNLDILLVEVKKNPKDAFLYYHLAATYGAMEEYEISLQHYLKCLELTPPNGFPGYLFNLLKRLALTYYELARFEDGIQFLDKMLAKKACEKFVDLYFLKGLCLKSLNRYNEAGKVFRHCQQIGDCDEFPSLRGRGSFLARLELARIHKEIGEVNAAVSNYVEAVLHPQNTCREGLVEFREYLHENNLSEIEQELVKLMFD